MSEIKYKSYDSTINNFKTKLQENGVAVVPNILTNEECVRYRDEIWKELKYVMKDRFDISKPETWREFYTLYPLHSMLLQHFSLGHMQPIWDIRQNEKVCEIFCKLWNCKKEDLIVSFDGLSIHLPPEDTRKGWFRKEWFHTDQSPKKEGLHCVQGMITLYDVREDDATLMVMEKSHRYHADFFDKKEFPEGESKEKLSDWYKLEEDEYDFFQKKKCEKKAVLASEGSIILWDSRTFHQGKEPDSKRNGKNFRMVIYICMMRRDTATDKVLTKKIKAFEELRVTNHWANNPKLFPKTPRTYGGDLPELNQIHQPVLSNLGRRLVGYDK